MEAGCSLICAWVKKHSAAWNQLDTCQEGNFERLLSGQIRSKCPCRGRGTHCSCRSRRLPLTVGNIGYWAWWLWCSLESNEENRMAKGATQVLHSSQSDRLRRMHLPFEGMRDYKGVHLRYFRKGTRGTTSCPRRRACAELRRHSRRLNRWMAVPVAL